jgi:predicted nucleotidyltransferase
MRSSSGANLPDYRDLATKGQIVQRAEMSRGGVSRFERHRHNLLFHDQSIVMMSAGRLAQVQLPRHRQWFRRGNSLLRRRGQKRSVAMTAITEQALMALGRLNVPQDVRDALGRLVTELLEASPKNIAGLIVYGGIARGRFRSGQSDVDLVVLLHDASVAALREIAPALRFAWRALRVEPFILSPEEVPRLALLFPTKLLDIQQHHVILLGEDPFAALVASQEEIRFRVEQELRNMALRLRRRFISVADDEHGQAQAIMSMIRPLAIQFGWLLRLAGQAADADNGTATIFSAAATKWHLDAELLSQLSAIRGGQREISDIPATFDRLVKVIGRAAEIAAGLKVGP